MLIFTKRNLLRNRDGKMNCLFVISAITCVQNPKTPSGRKGPSHLLSKAKVTYGEF